MAMIGIVPEELKEENYEFWKVCLKSYLVGKGLWDVVSKEATSKQEEATLDWKTKNAQALHAIQLACGSRAYSKYKKNTHISAKFAWDHLVEMHHSPTLHAEVSSEQDVSGNVLRIV
nr:ankyrin repeat family protein [Tanacetum cinerariifolium]